MKRLQGKSKANVFIMSFLFFILVFLIASSIKVPLLAEGSGTCQEGSCLCSCEGMYCTCVSGPGVQCQCMCSFPPAYEYCYREKHPEEPF